MSLSMHHASYILSAYGVAVAGMAVLILQSWLAMRRAEADAETLRRQRRERRS